MIWLIALAVVAAGLAIAGLVTDPKGRWATIKDYEDMGEYWETGCPFREFARQLLYWAGIQDKGRSDALSMVAVPVIIIGLFAALLKPSVPGPWWFWLLCLPIIVLEGYGPMGGVGELFHGDPVEDD